MEKINIAEILKDCPEGMELDCMIFDDSVKVIFDRVDKESNIIKIVAITDNNRTSYSLTEYGQWDSLPYAKCVIFPKGKTTWKGFHRPFKDGDIIYVCDEYSDATFTYVAILKQIEKGEKILSHCFYNFEDDYFSTHDFMFDYGYNTRFATEEEKQRLFKTIKDNGYKWNEETKTLEKLFEPKFKVGDRVEKFGIRFIISDIKDNYYLTKCGNNLPIDRQDEFKLVPNKFDISTLKPFDKVLVRLNNDNQWYATWFSHIDEKYESFGSHYVTVAGKSYTRMIPYKGNEHLLGKTDDCDEYYKTWE